MEILVPLSTPRPPKPRLNDDIHLFLNPFINTRDAEKYNQSNDTLMAIDKMDIFYTTNT